MRAERDIALCAVADAGVRSKVMNAMIQKSLPYAEEWHKVPLLRRRKYEGAKGCGQVTLSMLLLRRQKSWWHRREMPPAAGCTLIWMGCSGKGCCMLWHDVPETVSP